MRFLLPCVAAAALLASCGPKADQKPVVLSEAAAAGGGAPETLDAPEAAPSGFKLEALSEGEGDVQGCQTMLSSDGGREIFRASAADKDASGFLKIDGSIVQVDLVESEGDEKGHVRTYESADRKTRVVETLTSGDAHIDSDSVEQSGSLEVTHEGEKQTFQVKGGTAC